MKKTALLIIALTGAAFAQPKDAPKKEPPKDTKDAKPAPPAAMPAPKPAKELDALKDWLKTWNCTGTNPAGEKVTAKLGMKKELDGFWIGIKFEVAKTKTMPGFTGMAMMGIDGASKGWVVDGFDNHGGMIKMKATVADKSVTWDGDVIDGDKKVAGKFTMTVDDKKAMKFVGEFAGKTAFDYTCK